MLSLFTRYMKVSSNQRRCFRAAYEIIPHSVKRFKIHKGEAKIKYFCLPFEYKVDELVISKWGGILMKCGGIIEYST